MITPRRTLLIAGGGTGFRGLTPPLGWWGLTPPGFGAEAGHPLTAHRSLHTQSRGAR